MLIVKLEENKIPLLVNFNFNKFGTSGLIMILMPQALLIISIFGILRLKLCPSIMLIGNP